MSPNEGESVGAEALRVTGIDALMDVPGHAGDAEFLAYVAAGA